MTTSEKSSFVPAQLSNIKNSNLFPDILIDYLLYKHGELSLIVGYKSSLDFVDFITIFDHRDYHFYKYNWSDLFSYENIDLHLHRMKQIMSGEGKILSVDEMMEYSNFITNRYPDPTEGLRYETFLDFLNGTYKYK